MLREKQGYSATEREQDAGILGPLVSSPARGLRRRQQSRHGICLPSFRVRGPEQVIRLLEFASEMTKATFHT